MEKQKIIDYFDSVRDGMLEDVRALVRIRSDKTEPQPGMPFGPGPAAALSAALALGKKMGFSVRNYENYVGAVDLNGLPKQLDILAHLDVVPAGEGWQVTAPYEPAVKDGRLYGRGSADDKGPAVAALYAMKAVRDLGVPLKKNVRLILGTDEECGSADLTYYYEREPEAPMSFSPDAAFPVVNTEKGRFSTGFRAKYPVDRTLPRVVSVSGGDVINVVPGSAAAAVEGLSEAELKPFCEAAEREAGVRFGLRSGDGRVSIEAQGAPGHASAPEHSLNAVTGLLQLLASLPLADTAGVKALRAVNALFPHGDWRGKAAGIALSDGLSGELTISLDRFTLGETGLTGAFDCRTPVCATDENVRFVFRDKAASLGIELDDRSVAPAHHVPEGSEFVRTLLRCYEQYSGRKGRCMAIGGGTYAHRLKNGVAFGCALPGTENRMHAADEFAVVEELILSAEIFTQVIIDLCG